MSEQVVYKVRNAEGLWSRGGNVPEWSNIGKTWSNRGAIARHVVQVAQVRALHDHYAKVGTRYDIDRIVQAYWPQDWVIIPFVLVEQPACSGPSIRKG